MLNNEFEREERPDRERALPSSDETGPVSDREVPLDRAPGLPDSVHRWLDGETSEPAGMRGDSARTVEFWRRLGEETDKRRRMATPAGLSDKIMAALPPLAIEHAPVQPWFRRDVQVSTVTALAAGAALFTLGVIVASTLLAP